MSVCGRQGCENPLPPSKGPSPPRKWCSERCRKSQYDRACIDCGARVSGTTPGRSGGRCDPCARAAIAWSESARCISARERREAVVEQWARGDRMREIAARYGWTVDRFGVEMVRMRELGYDLPYRQSRPWREASRSARAAKAVAR